MPSVEADVPPAAGKANPRNNPNMFKIFQNVQYNVVQHKKYVKEMTKLYKKMDEDSFRESFKNALFYLFTFGDTSANVDRVVQFVATFCTTLDDEEEFLLFIFDIIFNCQCLSGQSIRYRASQLLAAVLAALGEDASLDDDLCDKLLNSQMQRLQDTRGAVRCRAALALQRLQNPMEQDDEVTRAYRFHMSCDPSSSVRRAVVMSIAKCTRNVPFVLERLCDVDEAVRRAAFLYIAAINVTQLRVRQRLLTLKVGLTERSPRVRRVVEEILIPGWLSTFKGNIVDLLKAIRLDNAQDAKDSQEVAGKLLESLFKRLPISELLEWLPTDSTLRLIPAEKLNKETAWYWRHLAEHLQRIDDDETLETVLPDLVVLTGYIKAIITSPCPSETDDPVGFSTRQYVLHELARLLHVYDAGDQIGREALQTVVTDALTGDYGPLNADVIRAFVLSLEMVVPEVSSRLVVVANIISELREPPEQEAPPPPPAAPVESTEAKLHRARLRVSLNVAMEAQEEAVREQNYALAEECKAKVKDIQVKLDKLNVQPAPPPPPPPIPTIREKISDADTLNKCLNILNCALDTPHITSMTPMLQMIFSELEVEIFQNPDVLESALETVALYGMLDKEFAKENKAFFFANLIDTTNERVVTTVLKCLVDLLCVHGAKVFEDDDVTQDDSAVGKKKRLTYDTLDEDGGISESVSMSQGHSTVIELLLNIMDSTCSTYRLIIAEGLCRLLHLGHLESPTILCRLLLLWFNPATVDEDMLRQIIGVFFQSFASSVEGAQEQIQKATIPTLRALANAPSSSPISEIDQEAVVRFIVSLTRVNHELSDSQGAMAMHLCSQLMARPSSSEAALVCRMLALLSPPRDACAGADLAAMLRDMCLKLPDKQSCRNLTRYLGALEATIVHKVSVSHAEDSLLHGRATTSLPQPIARSTHVVINETVEEEPEIDETSPPEAISRISEEPQPTSAEDQPPSPANPARSSTESEGSRPSDNTGSPTDRRGTESDSEGISPVKKVKVGKGKANYNRTNERMNEEHLQRRSSKDSGWIRPLDNAGSPIDGRGTVSDSEGVSPVKKVKVGKGKKKLSINRKDSGSDGAAKADNAKSKKDKPAAKESKKTTNCKEKLADSDNGGGVKRSRSQRSLVDVERAKKNNKAKSQPEKEVEKPPSPPKFDLDTSNITVRRSTRTLESRSSSESNGSDGKGKKGAQTKGKTKQDVEKPPSPPKFDLDTSNITVRRSTRTLESRSSSESNGSDGKGKKGPQTKGKTKQAAKPKGKKPAKKSASPRQTDDSGREASLFEDSADETELHTIVYDQGMAQSMLNDSSELQESAQGSKTNVTIPETPEGSDASESETEPEPKPAKTKGKPKGKFVALRYN